MSFLLVRLTGDLLSLLSQVNGSQVSLMSHQEVVKLIKCEIKLPHLCCETLLWVLFVLVLLLVSSDSVTFACCPIAGTYVALTLQGPPPSTASLPLEPLSIDHAPNQRASLGGEAPPSPPPPLPSGLSSIPSQRITGPKPLQVIYSTVYYYHHSTSPINGSL